jgi:predicted AAA+ superfamily ATPase
MEYERPVVETVSRMIRKGPPLLHVLVGARQVGKTTAAVQVVEKLGLPQVVGAADTALPPGPEWVETQWARARAEVGGRQRSVVLVLDEIQKVRGWSEEVKRLWDEDRRRGRSLHVMLLGSSSLLLHRGLSESLAGRFFLHRCPHWSWEECRKAFGWGLDRWLYFGGYPGSAPLADRPIEWRQYVADSLVETVLSRDVLQLQTVAKPALLRHLFALATCFPAQVLSYNKMLGQLQDAGNTTTLAHYLTLLETAFLVSGLELFSRGQRRKRGSSPKLVLWNQALINALSHRSMQDARADAAWWGRLVENAVGAHLLNHLPPIEWTVTYWRRGSAEVDYVVERGRALWALEVKSGRGGRVSGLMAFRALYPSARTLLIGSDGIPLEEFLGSDPRRVLEAVG